MIRFPAQDTHSTLAGGGGGGKAKGPSPPPPGGGGTFDGTETRVSRLEEDMKELKADMKTALKDLAYLKGKVDNLPTTLQLIGFAVAVFIAAGIARYFGR
ncbi:MAG: hypothetical protein WBG11_06070 [Methylocella sp.]